MVDWYQWGIRPLLFRGFNTDPEWLHQRFLETLERLSSTHKEPEDLPQWLRSAIERWLQQTCQVHDIRLNQTVWGLSFPNPMGLAAGFDKDGVAATAWPLLGFGYAELGTVTRHPQAGNPRPRLFRLPQDQAVINRMGFNNRGAAHIEARLRSLWQKGKPPIPFGINLGKSKITPLDAAVEDYVQSFQHLKALGDYFVVNVSSPNTPGLRKLQASENLAPILTGIQQENTDHKPLLVKISPDLTWNEIADILALADTHQLAGVIATNTTVRRHPLKTHRILKTGNLVAEELGGLSGRPLQQRSTEIIRFIYKETQGRIVIVGVGGIITAQDAWEKLSAGATLLQVYTGLVYGGPQLVQRVLQGLVQQLERHQISCISEVIGRELPFIRNVSHRSKAANARP